MTEQDAKFYTNSGIDKTNKADFRGALEDFNKSLELNPNWALTYFSKAIVFHNLRRLEDAYENYTKAIELDDKMIDAYYNRAHVLLIEKEISENDLKKALSDLEKAIELDNKFVDAMYYAAVVNDSEEEIEKWINFHADLGVKKFAFDIESIYFLGNREHINPKYKQLLQFASNCIAKKGLECIYYSFAEQMKYDDNM